MKYKDPAADRSPGYVSMAETLRFEVRHAQERLDLKQDQLRRWLLSHPEDGAPSIYEERTALVMGEDDDPFPEHVKR